MQCSEESMWRQQKQSVIDGQQVPYNLMWKVGQIYGSRTTRPVDNSARGQLGP